jgi:RibD C-terminal domain
VLAGDVVDEVSKLKRELDGEIVVYGSIRLPRALIEHDLADELRLMLYPVVLGAGERLFRETSDKKPMRLVDTKTVAGGVAILTYEPVRDPGQGKQHIPDMIGSQAALPHHHPYAGATMPEKPARTAASTASGTSPGCGRAPSHRQHRESADHRRVSRRVPPVLGRSARPRRGRPLDAAR